MHQGKVHALDYEGCQQWEFEHPENAAAGTSIHSHFVAVSDDNGLYIATGEYIFSLDRDGAVINQLSGKGYGGLLIGRDNTLYSLRGQQNPLIPAWRKLYWEKPKLGGLVKRPGAGQS